VQNCCISSSGLKSDITIVFLATDFLKDAKILAIRIHLRQMFDYLMFAWVFRTSWPKMGFSGQNRGKGGAILTSTKSFLFLGVLTYVLILVKIDQEMRP